MIVVSDTTPLISLMKADCLWILESLYQEVLIPEAVFNELTTNPKYPEEAEQIRSSAFIKVVKVKDPRVVDILRRAAGIDIGESEAIVYADDVNADYLLVDEGAARKVAENMQLRIVGSVGAMLTAFENELMSADEVEVALNKLKKTKRFIGREIYSYAMIKIGKQKGTN